MVDAAASWLFFLLLVLLVLLLISVFPGLLLLLMCLVEAVVLMEDPRCWCLGTPALRGGMTGQGEKRGMFRVSVLCVLWVEILMPMAMRRVLQKSLAITLPVQIKIH